MRTAAIIAEFNPYHNGHGYLLKKAREGGAEGIICLMSGDFVQRGAPAVAERHLRARMAMEDADIVLSLPTRFSAATAEEFASASVRILDGLDCVDELWFGSESGSVEPLEMCARLLDEEPPEYRALLRRQLSSGASFAKARSRAAASFCGLEDLEDLLRKPNNILAVEYLKALIRQKSKIVPHTVPRFGAGHDELLPGGLTDAPETSRNDRKQRMREDARLSFSSSSGIRERLNSFPEGEKDLRRVMPEKACALLLESVRVNGIPAEDDFSEILLNRLWEARDPLEFAAYKEVGEELSRTIFKNRELYRGVHSFSDLLTSKTLPRSRARRALLHITLGIRKDDAMDGTSCAQVLAMNSTGEKILSEWKNSSEEHVTELVVNPAKDIPFLASASGAVMEEEFRLSNLYNHLSALKSGQPFTEEHRRPVVRC